MKPYSAILINRETKFVTGEDIYLKFVIVNEEGTVQTSLTGWTFNAHLENGVDELQLDTDDCTVSGAIVTVYIADTDSDDLEDTEHEFELVGTLATKKYHLFYPCQCSQLEHYG